MESDRHYFLEGLFVIVLSLAIALFFVWLAKTGAKDDITYRIYFEESVSGMTLGDPVKYLGVDVGTVKQMGIAPGDAQRVRVDVQLRKETPVKTDTKAKLKLKGITGVVFIELDAGAAKGQDLAAATPPGQIPEIPSEKSALNTALELLPKVIAKFSNIEDKAQKVVADVGETAAKVKENPSLLLRRPKNNKDEKPAKPPEERR
jgi:phospholipid/cholesterol/gamma-HCH transport system substrate-binding protein